MASARLLRRLFHIQTLLATAGAITIAAHTPMAHAQVDQGAITGTVVDSTGAAVPNAQVTLLNTDQGITLQTQSSSSGSYTFAPVRIGNYTVTASAPGFATTTQQKLTVNVGQQLQVNVALQTGSASESVTVSTAPPQLQSDESSVGQVVDEHTIVSLPLNGRNFTFLAQLSAGVNSSQADTRGNASSGAFNSERSAASAEQLPARRHRQQLEPRLTF